MHVRLIPQLTIEDSVNKMQMERPEQKIGQCLRGNYALHHIENASESVVDVFALAVVRKYKLGTRRAEMDCA